MNTKLSFYQETHQKEKGYAGSTYHVPGLCKTRAFKQWITEHQKQEVRMLDIGCGKGMFLKDLVHYLSHNNTIKPKKVTGLDLLQSPDNIFSDIPCFEFVKQDIDGQSLSFPDNCFDLVILNHVLEHVFETEKLLKEIRRILANTGLAVISVPNIAAWINRFLFLFGSQPLGSEVGTESISYGFWPTAGQKRLAEYKPAGHIRDFTPRALAEICKTCGLRPVGWWNQSRTPLFPLTKWAGRNMGILVIPI